MYRVYGAHPTRTTRVLWMLEELGAPYEIVHANPRSPEALAVNPSGKVPVLEVVEEGFRLIDSAAICQFLADRHPEAGMTFPAGSRQRAEMDSWLHFAMSDLEVPVWTQSKHTFLYPEELRAPAVLPACGFEWSAAISAMDQRLEAQGWTGPYIMGEAFTVPDIVLGHIGRWAHVIKLEVKIPRVADYFERALARPALKRAAERGAKECPR